MEKGSTADKSGSIRRNGASLGVKVYVFLIAVIFIVSAAFQFMVAGAYRDDMTASLTVKTEEASGRAEASDSGTEQELHAKLRHFLIRSTLVVISLTAAASLISIAWLRRSLVRPMRGLARAAKEFIPEEDGTYSETRISRVEVSSRDELGDLSREIRSMQEQIVESTGNLARMTAEKERIVTELELAKSIQASALPRVFPPFPDRTEFELYASMTPARAVGGDFYDYFLIDDDHLALVIADVSGKGIPAALFMMISMALIRNQLTNGSPDPAEALQRVNRQLCERNESMQFVTVWLAVLELSTGKGAACNAGHEHPAFRRAGEPFEMLQYKHGVAVGVIETARYQTREFEMHPGDCLFVYTDGVAEAHSASRELFGENRIMETLNRSADADPETLIRQVHEAVDRFADGTDQFDDITMLCLQYNGAAGKPKNDRNASFEADGKPDGEPEDGSGQ